MIMQLSQKRTCNGCRAYASYSHAINSCELGYKQISKYRKDIGITNYFPDEPCLKPLTVSDYSEAFQRVSNARQTN